jgi:head-tail adaptor
MSMAGARREIVTFQQHGPDENGDALGTWTDSFSRWGRVQVRKGGEEVLQQRQQGVTLVIITVPSDDETRAVTSAWRAVWNGVPFNLSAPAPAEDRSMIAFEGKEDGSDD